MLAQLTTLQQRATNKAITLFASGERNVLIQSMTGSGKTYMGLGIGQWHLDESVDNKLLIVVPTVALVEQFHETAQAFGFSVAIYHGQLTHRFDAQGNKIAMQQMADLPNARIVITLPDTFATLIAGTNHYGWDDSWEPTMLLMDEAHKNTSANSQAVRDAFENLQFLLGLTATPRREQNKNGEFLLDWYGDNLIIAASPRELIEAKRIVPPVIKEYGVAAVEVDEWFAATEEYSNKTTIIVARDTDHAYALTQAFKSRKIDARQITTVGNASIASQTVKQRQALLADFRNGLFPVLVSVDTVCEGFDCPRVQFVMICRDMTSEALYHQVVGRALRTFEDKTHGVVMDFGGNHKRFGSIVERIWTVADYAPVVTVSKDRTVSVGSWNRAKSMMIVCNCCDKVYDIKARPACPACKQTHNIRCVVTVGEIVDCYGLGRDVYKTQGAQLQSVAVSTMPNHPLRSFLNSSLQWPVFCDNTGKANKGHEVMANIIKNQRKLGERLVVEPRILPQYVLDKLAA